MAKVPTDRAKRVQHSEQLCWTCETKVQAERSRAPWGVADLVMIVITLGFWIPLKMIYHAGASPWRCVECRSRIEPWPRSLGRAAAYGFGGLMAAWVVVPGVIAVAAGGPTTDDNASEGTAKAIAGENDRREKAASEFESNRDRIITEIRSALQAGSYGKAVQQAKPYLFLEDPTVLELHKAAQKKARESRLLASLERTPESDIDRRTKAYGELTRLDPTNASYKAKHDTYAAKVRARDAKVAAERAALEKKRAAEQAARNATIAKFGETPTQSAWDGSYYEVERYLKQVANDPDSIDIDACTKVYRGDDGWLVGCDYRGRNGFGGMIRQSNWFTIRHGRVVAMHAADRYRP